MILAVDSCQWATATCLGGGGAANKYDSTRSIGGHFLITAGRDGNPFGAYAANFSGVVAETIFSARQVWRNTCSLMIAGTGSPAETIFASYFSGVVCVATASVDLGGFIRIRQGGNGVDVLGALLYKSQGHLLPNVWYSVDLDWMFSTGVGIGWADLYINDVLDTMGGHSVNGVTWGVYPSSFAWVLYELTAGYQMCDLVLSDNQGASNTGRLGPCRVEMSTFSTTNVSQWPTIVPGGYTPVHAISDTPITTPSGSPDGFASYIQTAGLNSETLFSGSNNTCYAKILAVALSACIIDASNGNVDMIVRPTPSAGSLDDHFIGTIFPPPAFGTGQPCILQAITEINPDTGNIWLDGDIKNAWWGVKCVTGTPLLTQLVIEKVTTRRAVPFTCGTLGSYAIQR